MLKLLIFARGAALAASAFTASAAAAEPAQPVDDLGQIRAIFDDALRDYPATRFRRVQIGVRMNGRQTVCGEINPKNAYGGYEGWKFFGIEFRQGANPIFGVQGDTDGEWIKTTCANSTTSLPPEDRSAEVAYSVRPAPSAAPSPPARPPRRR